MSLRRAPRLVLSRRYVLLQRRSVTAVSTPKPPTPDFIKKLQTRQDEGVIEDSLEETLRSHRKINKAAFTTLKTLKTSGHNSSLRLSKKNGRAQQHHENISSILERARDTGGSVIMPETVQSDQRADVWRPLDAQWPSDRLLSLHQDTLHHLKWLQLTDSEISLRRDLVHSLIKRLKAKLPDSEFELFGSFVIGLSRPSSDIDLGFYIPSLYPEPGGRGPSPHRPSALKKIRARLHEIKTILSNSLEWSVKDTVFNTKFPLVEMLHRPSGIQVQIVSSRNSPQYAATLIDYVQEWPQIRPLFFVLKAALASRNLHVPAEGGMGSYCLLVMLIALVRHKRIAKSADCASTLQAFLDFWGNFDTKGFGISADPPVIFPKRPSDWKPKKEEAQAIAADEYLDAQLKLGTIKKKHEDIYLCLQDPLDPLNNVAKSTRRILDILKTFKYLSELMAEWLEERAPLDDFLVHLIGAAAVKEAKSRRMTVDWAARNGMRNLLDLQFLPSPTKHQNRRLRLPAKEQKAASDESQS